MPLTTLTVIRSAPLGDDDAAERWLDELRTDHDKLAAELAEALVLINRAIHTHRAAVLDPTLADVDAERALVARVGFGDGDELADGRFARALEVPRSSRARRVEGLRPQERLAGVLSGREQVAACELLILRARTDLDAERVREAALQLRVGLEALLAERQALRGARTGAGPRGARRAPPDHRRGGQRGAETVSSVKGGRRRWPKRCASASAYCGDGERSA